jgi:plastocyanin
MAFSRASQSFPHFVPGLAAWLAPSSSEFFHPASQTWPPLAIDIHYHYYAQMGIVLTFKHTQLLLGAFMKIGRHLASSRLQVTANALAMMALLGAPAAMAADGEFALTIQDHRFQPAELVVPAGKKIKLSVENRDATPEEFESHDLNREKVIAGKSTATIFIGPLAPGRYRYFGEFNEKTAQGVIVAQ